MFAAAGSSFWSPSAPQMWEHCRPSSPSSVILLLYHLGLGQGVENECCSWFFVLVTLSPTVVGALSAQLTQLNGPFPPSALLRGLPRCWRVCQHGYHFVIFSHFILSTSYSTARSLPVKELSTLTSGGRKIWTVADSLPRKRKTGFLPGRARRTISMAILHKIRNSIQKRETYQPYPDIKNC